MCKIVKADNKLVLPWVQINRLMILQIQKIKTKINKANNNKTIEIMDTLQILKIKELKILDNRIHSI